MEIHKRFFPEILLDNEANYLAMLQGIVESVDEYASMEITKVPEAYKFRIVPSLPRYNNMLLEEILKLNNLFHIRLDLGKSIKTSSTITFQIELN
jgi:hypothetical protein